MSDMDYCPYREFANNLKEGYVNLPIDRSYQRKVAKLCSAPDKVNAFFESVLAPNLVNEPLKQHLPIFERKSSDFGDVGSKKAERELRSGEPIQQFYPFFANVLRCPAFGPGRSRKSDAYAQRWEKPSKRACAAPFWIFTFEHDDTEEGALQLQLDWIWKKGECGRTEIEKIDASLRASFKDYRGYCVVWSGSKSLHIHLVFDTSHLSRDVVKSLAERAGKSPEAKLRDHWHGLDANPAALWRYYREQWFMLRNIIHEMSDIDVPFDEQMAVLSQKRRMPWGLRVVEEGNPFGCPEDDFIVQAVVAEKVLKRSAKGAIGYFNTVDAANSVPVLTSAVSVKSAQQQLRIDNDEMLRRMTLYLGQHWGVKYPKPAFFAEQDGLIQLHFYNDAKDQKPSSFVREDYSAILYFGQGTPADENFSRLPGGLNLHDLLLALMDEEEWQDQLEPVTSAAPKRLKRGQRARHIFEQEAWGGDRAGVHKGLTRAVKTLTRDHPRNFIVSAPGAGKSTALLDQAFDYRAEDWLETFFEGQGLVGPLKGFTIFACQSYNQAEEQFQRYVAPTTEGKVRPAVLLKSFEQHYRDYCEEEWTCHGLVPPRVLV